MVLAFGGRRVSDLRLDYGVEVDPRSGAGGLRVPVPAPIGRNGLSPQLSLRYSSGAGNSVIGAGWALDGLPAITIDTRYHVPRWDGNDGYQLSGDELVPWLEEQHGQWTPRGFVTGTWSVAFLRSRRGSSKTRVEKWTDTSTGRVHFRTRDPGNSVTIFGERAQAAARIADPVDEARTLAWLPEVQIDPHGNALWFEYAPETLDNIDRSAPWERRSPSLAQRYLKRIRYGNVSPLTVDAALAAGASPDGRWCFQLVFDYGDHASPDLPTTIPDRTWPARRDPFSSYRNGFELRTFRLCRRILSFHEFDQLGIDPALVQALVLTHEEDVAGSALAQISQLGYRSDAGVATTKSIPALKLTYAPSATGTSFVDASVTAVENVPAGLAGQRYSFVDLHGDGLPGILNESDRTWFYKPNRGGGEFGAQTIVLERPATRSGAWGFGDVDANGNTDLSQLSGRLAGRFELDRDDHTWGGFEPFARFPHVEGVGARAQWVDLNGDGRPDLVVAKQHSFVWFASDGDEFEPPIELPRPEGADAAPTLAADLGLDLFFADMTGDGLADLVRVSNGRVEYWPSLGNGRFGDVVVMDDAPRFDDDSEFDPTRLRFVDLDGSGTTDLVYLGRGEVRCFVNASGNQWVDGPQLVGLPYLDNTATARVLDFLADGRACLVWSSPLPRATTALSYLPLTPSTPPRLLIEVDDSLGQLTRLTYSSSSSHYLRDLASGRGWSSHLPSHGPVVDRLEITDQIGNTRSVQRYEYHDGVYDGRERESRGFGQVDIYDAATADGSTPGPDAVAFSAPSLTRTWFHTGMPMWRRDRLRDAYLADPQLPQLAPHVIDDADLLGIDEIEDGLRALAGSVVRSEVYAVDDHGAPSAVPFEVQQSSFRLRRLQPAFADAAAAFSVITLEAAHWTYEKAAGDPRVQHEIVVETDEYDVPQREVTIGYSRRVGIARDVAAQDRNYLQVNDRRLLHIDQAGRYELAIPIELHRIELAGLRPNQLGVFTRDQLRASAVANALAVPGEHYIDLGDDPALGPQARLLGWEQSFYWDDGRTAALPLGAIGSTTLVHHEEAACFAPAFIADALQGKISDATLGASGYVQRDGLWWTVDEQHAFASASQFSQRVGLRRGDGASATFAYDPYALQVVSSTDPLGNTVTAEIDYYQLAPSALTDANGNRSEVRYDALGVVVTATGYGHVAAQSWGFDALTAVVPRTPITLDDGVANASQFLQGAARFVWYDLDAWARDATPTATLALVREALVSDGAGGGTTNGRIQIGVAYFDGLGRTLQEKTLVEAGTAIQRAGDGSVVVDTSGQPVLAPADPRWRVSGHVAYDNKQRPGRAFQPYFSPSLAYESDAVLQTFGAATVNRYDSLGRIIGVDLPNGTLVTSTYRAWSTERADANDNIAGSLWAITRATLPASDPERQAYEQAKLHADTTTSTFLDGLGRECSTLVRGGTTAQDRRTESQFDIEGQARVIVDPRTLEAITARFDMQGRAVASHSIDAGDRWTFTDAYDREVRTWNGRGFTITRGFDVEDRPLYVDVTGGDGAQPLDHRVEEWIYGESLNRADAASKNLLGRVVAVHDAGGTTVVDRYDPLGRALVATRKLRSDVDHEPDWRTTVGLESDTFAIAAAFDGLGRPTTETLVDGTTRSFQYLQSGAVQRISVTTPDGVLHDVPILDGTTIGARGERLSASLGNAAQLSWAYDPSTFRLVSQGATVAGRTLQDISYTYDPVGNITSLLDGAQEGTTSIVSGVVVSARRDYTYDAHYRLLTATGRVHQALLQNDYIPGSPGTIKSTRHLSLNNGLAVERFTRSYAYDASGNLQYVKHAGATQSWTTNLWVSTTSNRSLPALDPNGIAITNPEANFDASGNVRTLSHLRSIEWSWRDSLARAVVIARPGGTDDAERYVYGADAQRVRKLTTRLVQNGVVETTEKVYFGDVERKRITRGTQLILERWTIHVSDGSQQIALIHRWTRDDQAREVGDPSKPHVRYQLGTHQGSAAIELDETGNLISYEEYFPHGGTAFIAGDDEREIDVKEYRYCSKECDDFTGLYYYGYRYLAPWMGRWLSPDPSGPQDDLNLYQFVLGNPVGNVDLDGLDTKTPGPGEIVYRNHRPPVGADTIEGKLANYRAALHGQPEYQKGFDSLTHDQQVRLVTESGTALVPKDPRSDHATTFTVLSGDEYRATWQPANSAWAAEQHTYVRVEVFSENPNQIHTNDAPSGPHDDPPSHAPPTTTKGTDKKAKPDPNDGGKKTGSHGSKNTEGNGGDAGKARGSGTAARGEGSATGLGGFGTYEADEYGNTLGGQAGGSAGGELGGTPFSVGHTRGSAGSAVDGPIGAGVGSGNSAQSPSQSVAGVGAHGPSGRARGATSGIGEGRQISHGDPGSAETGGSATGANGALGQGNTGAKQDGQTPSKPYGWKNVLLDVAGLMNFVFSEREGGDEKGTPGSLGWLPISGDWAQWAYILTSFVAFIDLIKNFASLLSGLVNLGKGLLRMGWRLLRELPNLPRLGFRALVRGTEFLRALFRFPRRLSAGSSLSEGFITVYRGLSHSHVDFAAQSQGLVRPNRRWWQLWKRASTPLEHNVAPGGTLNSPFTSWTTDIRVAENYALRPKLELGVIITARIPLSRIVMSPNLKVVGHIMTGESLSEAEVLVRGVVRGHPRFVP